MKAKSLLLVSVIGAAAVGGALTGTTVASWRDSSAMNAGVLRTGDLGLSANAAGGSALRLTPGQSTAVPLTLTTTGAGKNLRATASLVGVQGGEHVGLRFRRQTSDTDRCTTDGGATPFTTWAGSPIRLTDPAPPGTVRLCLVLTASTEAMPAEMESTLRLDFVAQQSREGRTVGWSAATSASLPVSVVPADATQGVPESSVPTAAP